MADPRPVTGMTCTVPRAPAVPGTRIAEIVAETVPG